MLEASEKLKCGHRIKSTKEFQGRNNSVTFTKEDARGVHFSHNDPLVLIVQRANTMVHRMLIDNRSLVDILYFIALKKTGLGLKDLKFYASLIYGFTGDNRVSPHSLGMTSTFHGIATLKGEQKEAIECYNMSLKIATKPREPMTMTVHGGLNLVGETSSKLDAQVCEEVLVESMEELEEIVILENPFKILKIGKGLLEALKRELRQNLENNVDVLTWSHEDMEGVDPTLMCHHLNIDPNARLVRQK
uniref:Reverse transcriptase domain-containing protein n=1 Tax=Cannabis sativa TaxID=3483 RepID=A0A803PAY7_CANSA